MACHVRRIHVEMCVSLLGVLLGLISFFVFVPVYHNYEAGLLGLMSGIFAVITFMIHLLHYRSYLTRDMVKTLERMEFLGFVGICLGAAFIIYYIFMMIYYKLPVLPVETSDVIKLVWAFMVFKWGNGLFFSTRRYLNLVDSDIENIE